MIFLYKSLLYLDYFYLLCWTMSECIFCKIIAGEIPAVKIWENEDIFVFLDIHPLRKWHCLIIPKHHYQDIFDIDESVLQQSIVLAKHIAQTMKISLWATGVNILHASWKDAEQSVGHFHLHLVPRYHDDGLSMNDWRIPNTQNFSLDELHDIAAHITQALT